MNDITSPSTSPKSGSRRANALPSDYMLDEYRIDSILGAGGFGVTYKALDTHLRTWVAIKEYFPVEWSFRDSDGVTVYANTQGQSSQNDGQISDYAWGLERFLDEARVLAQIQHPYVVRVKRYFRAHGTAYIVMDYEEGEPLSAVLQDGETLDEEEVRGLLEDVLPALQAVHEQGYLHRDIKPANLYLRASDHRVILIDFGAARGAVGRQSKSVTSLVTPGYSPPEQYTTRNERYGTWTDIYALAAVLYRCVTGHPPVEAAERLLDDHLQPATEVGAGRYSTNLLRVIDRSLAVRPELRFRTVAEMQAALDGSQVESNDETVIVLPRARSSKATSVPEPPPSRDESVQAPIENQPVGEDWLEVTKKSATESQGLLVVQKPKKTRPFVPHVLQWQSLGLQIGGSLALAVAAGLVVTVVVWLWPSAPTPEEQSPPRYSLGQHEQPVVVPPAAVTEPSGISASNGTAVPEPVAAPAMSDSPVTPSTPGPSESPVAGADAPTEPPSTVTDTAAEPPLQEESTTADGATESAAPVAEPSFQEEPTTAGGAAESTAGTGVVPLAPAALSAAALSAAARRGESSTAQPASKPVAAQPAPRSRKAERRAERSRTSQKRDELKPIVVTPPALRRTQPAPASRKLWEPPTSTGFNQK